jgi:hypothetical protein
MSLYDLEKKVMDLKTKLNLSIDLDLKKQQEYEQLQLFKLVRDQKITLIKKELKGETDINVIKNKIRNELCKDKLHNMNCNELESYLIQLKLNELQILEDLEHKLKEDSLNINKPINLLLENEKELLNQYNKHNEELLNKLNNELKQIQEDNKLKQEEEEKMLVEKQLKEIEDENKKQLEEEYKRKQMEFDLIYNNLVENENHTEIDLVRLEKERKIKELEELQKQLISELE